MVAADLEVGRVVARRHLQRARAEPDLDPLVADDRHRPVDQRHERGAPDQVRPARVVGVHGDAVSARIVIGRTVAITISPPPSTS